MINSFLVTLHNSATPPVNASSSTGDILWPANYLVKDYAGDSEQANIVLFGGYTPADFNHFLIAIQLLWVVEESVLADTIFEDDTRITYDRTQLEGQFTDIAPSVFERQQISRILQNFDSIPALRFLTGDLLDVYRSALSRLDKLAAVVAYFGKRQNV